MQTERILVDAIQCADRMRAFSPERVQALADSMAALGLRTPVTVKIIPEVREADGSITEGVPVLIAGRHRLEAAKLLGWEEIDSIVMEGDERDYRLWEIAENLHRAELTVQERAEHIAEWVRITGEKVGQVVPPGGKQPADKGIREAARSLPVSGDTEEAKRKNVERAIKIAALTPEAKEAARETGRDDNQSALLKAAKAPAEEQARVIREYEPTPRVKPAPAPLNDIETEETWMAGIMRFWNRAAPQWREHFMERVDTPAFDSTSAGRAT